MTGRASKLKALAFGVGCVLLVVLAIGVTRASLSDGSGAQSAGPVPDLPSDAPVIKSGPLGVFEPVRGWIVYPIGDGLKAVNPADPAERHTLELPAGMDTLLGGGGDGANRPQPAGWSADGTKLALSHEYFGDSFVMTADGSITRQVFGPRGCCGFVAEAWLSPDGTTGLDGVGPEGIRYYDLSPSRYSSLRTLEPPLAADRQAWGAAWSADGSRIAFVAVADQEGTKPTLHVASFSTGANQPLRGPAVGHIRHIVWSPNDADLLVVAGATLPPNSQLNPLVHPQATKLFLVATDGSAPAREIASGYYVAAAWSPDGTQIAAIEYSPSGRELVVMNADGTGSRPLVELPAGELFTGVAWHPLPDQD